MKWTIILRTSKLSSKLLLISTEEEGQVRQELSLMDVVWGLYDVRKSNGVWDHSKRVKHLCAFLFLKKKNRKLFLIDILSCNRRAESGIHFIFFAIEYNIRLWDGPEPFGKIPDPRWHISLAKKGALDHISFGECFLLLVFSNKNLRVTKEGVMSVCAKVHFIERVIWKGLPGRWNIEEESKIASTILNCPIWFVSWSLSV